MAAPNFSVSGRVTDAASAVCDADCPVRASLAVLGTKWALLIVRDLLGGPRRFGELLVSVSGISAKVLTDRLRELEACGVVRREVRSGGPVRVVYSLTEQGRDLRQVIDALGAWGAGLPGRTLSRVPAGVR